MMLLHSSQLVLALLLQPSTAPPPTGSYGGEPATCEGLAAIALTNTTVTHAETVTTGTLVPPGSNQGLTRLPHFCRVAGVITTTPESRIRFEVWLPLEGWNGRFAGVGNGGWGGAISYHALAEQLRRGYAAGSTDTGHPAEPGVNAARFGYHHPEQLTDFAHRAVHEMTVASKTLVQAFYGQSPRYSYFIGCSAGGRQALMEAQRYPLDYDGIVAGAPANNLTRKEAGALDALLAMRAEPGSYLAEPAVEWLNGAVVEACDALDGVTDGVVEDPRVCTFDPAALRCAADRSDGCLSAAQVRAAQRVYAGLKHPHTGEQLYPGLARGSERGWARPLNPDAPFTIPISLFQWLVLRDSTWDWTTFDYSRSADLDAFLAFDRAWGPVLNAFDSDLGEFHRRGGKLIHYHGWNDPLIAPENSIDYYEHVVARASANDRAAAIREVQGFYRLFMAPGYNHCRGGAGPSVFDMQAALEIWVERGEAPESVIARRHRDGRQDRSRPLCPYPRVAVYKGRGDTNDAANFQCQDPPPSAPAPAASVGSAEDERAIRSVLNQWSSFLADDAEWENPAGQVFRGKAEIGAFLDQVRRAQPNRRAVRTELRVRFITPDVAVADVVRVTEGEVGPGGEARPPRPLRFTHVLRKENGVWRDVVVRTALLPQRD
jgi:feruloyl esterase